MDTKVFNTDPTSSHEAIIHLLGREVDGTVLPVDSFKNTASWIGIPLVFAKQHIPLTCPVTALDDSRLPQFLADVEGLIVGEVTAANIDMSGTPKLIETLTFTSDTAKRLVSKGVDIGEGVEEAVGRAKKLHESGKLSLSSAFCAKRDGNTISGDVRPHHILLFEETEVDQPRDRSATFLNKEPMTKDSLVEEGILMTETPNPLQEEFEALKQQHEELRTVSEGYKSEIEGYKSEITDLKTKVETFTNKIEEYKQVEKDQAWEQIKNKLPPGLVHGEEAEKSAREEFESAPSAFMNKVLDYKPAAGTPEEGEAFTHQKDGKTDPSATVSELYQITGRKL